VIFDIVGYIKMEWTKPNESRICKTVLILKKKKKSVAGQFAVKSRPALQDTKTKQGRLRGRQVLLTSCCCTRVNTVEKQ
jgi:hypothetical protein